MRHPPLFWSGHPLRRIGYVPPPYPVLEVVRPTYFKVSIRGGLPSMAWPRRGAGWAREVLKWRCHSGDLANPARLVGAGAISVRPPRIETWGLFGGGLDAVGGKRFVGWPFGGGMGLRGGHVTPGT